MILSSMLSPIASSALSKAAVSCFFVTSESFPMSAGCVGEDERARDGGAEGAGGDEAGGERDAGMEGGWALVSTLPMDLCVWTWTDTQFV